MSAETTTSWILDLVDQITRPARNIMRTVTGMTDDINEATDAVRFNETETREALQNSREHYRDLEQQVSRVEDEVKSLERAAQRAAPGEQMVRANQAYAEGVARLNRLRAALQGAEHDVDDLTESVEEFAHESQTSFADVVTGINQGMELMQKGIDSLEFTNEIEDLRVNIQRMTEASGTALDELTDKSYKLGQVFNENPDEIMKAANAMTKQLGGTYQQNLDWIEEGYEKGANLNGDMIDQLKEYTPQLKELGINGSQAIALMAKAGKEGVFSDKAIDSIKEANLSLREMGQTQIDALAGIKLKPEDLVGKTPFEAVQLITKQMQGASSQARQLVMTDIFKGAGEDAGFQFVEGLSSVDLDINKIPSFKQSGSDINSWLADLKTSFSDTFGGIAGTALQIAPLITAVASAIPLIQALTKSQWFLNLAMDANPIGIIVIAIAAMIAGIVLAIKYYDEWGAALLMIMGPLGWVVNIIMALKNNWDSIVEAFQKDGIIAGIKRIGIVILDAILLPVQQLLELLAKIPGMGNLAGKGANYIKEMRAGLELKDPEKKKEEEETKTPSVNEYVSGTPTLGAPAPPKGKGKKEGDGLNVGSGSNGIKSIVMNLDIKNYFTVSKGTDTRSIADRVVGHVNDRMRDAVINLGG